MIYIVYFKIQFIDKKKKYAIITNVLSECFDPHC